MKDLQKGCLSWKKYMGDYEVSNMGTVRRLKPLGYKIIKPQPFHQAPKRHYVDLSVDGKKIRRKICVMVAHCFHGARPKGKVINHKDGDPSNDRESNIEYVTQAKNCKHAYEIGLRSAKGENNGRAKLFGTTGCKN